MSEGTFSSVTALIFTLTYTSISCCNKHNKYYFESVVYMRVELSHN